MKTLPTKYPYRQFTDPLTAGPTESAILKVWITHNDNKGIPWAVTKEDKGYGIYHQLWVWGEALKVSKAGGNLDEIPEAKIYMTGNGFEDLLENYKHRKRRAA